jgi:hypothetical protein
MSRRGNGSEGVQEDFLIDRFFAVRFHEIEIRMLVM